MIDEENTIEEERDEYLNSWKRALADLENYKKKEKQKLQETSQRTVDIIAKDILPIIDNLERAESALTKKHEKDSVAQGFIQIGKQLKDLLEDYEVEEVEAIGEQFDPNLHEALMEIDDEDAESGEVIEVLEKGYMRQGNLLRPAKVKVAK